MGVVTLVEFLRARVDEDEAEINQHPDPAEVGDEERGYLAITELGYPCTPQLTVGKLRALAEVDAKRRIIELHESWPVLAETEPELVSGTDTDSMSLAVSKRIAWLTTQEYRARFGDEPPTNPVLRLLALPHADHPDYDPSWRP